MPAIAIDVTDEHGASISPPIEIDLPNTNGSPTDHRTYSCGNLSGLLTVDYQLEIDSPDTAWVVEIAEGWVSESYFNIESMSLLRPRLLS